MPPCLRYEPPSPITLPRELVDALDSMFGVSDDGWAEILDETEWAALVAVVEPGTDPVETTGAVVAAARNVCDLWTLSSSCDSREDVPVGEGCEFCVWCQALIIRDWFDKVLDDAGLTERRGLGKYIHAVDYDPAAEYERLWALLSSAP